MKSQNTYLNLVGFDSPEEAFIKIKDWSSELTDDDHFVRSVIFDIHAGIEYLLREILFFHFKAIIFQDGNVKDTDRIQDVKNMVNKLGFGQVMNLLWPILKNWPYDIHSIKPLTDLRNQIAHESDIGKIKYKGRNPFKDADSFAQVFFDAWASRQELNKFLRRQVG